MREFQRVVLVFVLFFSAVAAAEEPVNFAVTPIIRVIPKLPEGMKRDEIQQGYVTIQFEITETGSVENPYVVESKPAKLYDRVSLEAILKFKFKPHVVNGKPTRVTAMQTIEFEGKNDRKFDAGNDLKKYRTEQLSLKMDRFEKDFDFKSTLVITDVATGNVIRKMPLPDSEVDWGLMASSPTSPYVFFYHSISRSKAKLKIYKRLGMELLHDLDFDHVSQTHTGQSAAYDIFFTLKNDEQLMAVVGKKRPKLITVDGATGRITEHMSIEKNSLVEYSPDGKYLWARKVSTVKDKTIPSNLQIIETSGFTVIKEIPIKIRVVGIHYIDGILELTFQYEFTDQSYRRMFLRLSDLEYIGDFRTSNKSGFAHDVGANKAWVVFGKSEDNKHLKVAKLENGEYTLLTENEWVIDYNFVEINSRDEDPSFFFYGDKKFLRFNIFKPDKRFDVDVPFNVITSYANSDGTKLYLTEKHGDSLALIDMEAKKLVASAESERGAFKFGQYKNILKDLAISIPPGYDTNHGKNGFAKSDNIIFLNNNANRVFLLRLDSSYVTSFAADDLSDEQAVDTGRQTFQLAQRIGDPDAPILAIGIKQITFLNPHTGKVISQFKYDAPERITSMHELSYWEDKEFKTIALEKLMEDGK